MNDPIPGLPDLVDDPGAPPEVMEVRVRGLRDVRLRVEVDRFVWEWFDVLRLAVGVYKDGVRSSATPLDHFRQYIEEGVRRIFRTALAGGVPVDEAAGIAGREGGTFLAPVVFVWRVLESTVAVPGTAADGHAMLARYLARRPLQLAAVRQAFADTDEFPPQLRPAVRRVVIAAEAEARRN